MNSVIPYVKWLGRRLRQRKQEPRCEGFVVVEGRSVEAVHTGVQRVEEAERALTEW